VGFFFFGFSADEQPSLLVYAALGVPPFRSVKLRKRRATCPACGTEGQKVGKIEEIDYVQFCGGARPDWEALGLNPGEGEERITASVRARFLRSFFFFLLSGGPELSDKNGCLLHVDDGSVNLS
jgi:hypothetical protein